VTQVPPRASEGDLGSRAGPFVSTIAPPHAERNDAGAVRHSVGGKVAGSTNRTEVLQSGHGFNARDGEQSFALS
jgi:hypothetical protein